MTENDFRGTVERRRQRVGSQLMSNLRTILLAAGSFSTTGFCASSSTAAVRICGQPVVAAASAATEREAKKAALAQWKAAASVLGPGYEAWRLASEKVLHCKPGAAGAIDCVAKGRPCTIEQAPDTRDIRKKRLET